MHKKRRGLCFHKQSEEPWTSKEYDKIRYYVGNSFDPLDRPLSKYIFDDEQGSETYFQDDWSQSKPHSHQKQIIFETLKIKSVLYATLTKLL